jgi:hypothetical protein
VTLQLPVQLSVMACSVALPLHITLIPEPLPANPKLPSLAISPVKPGNAPLVVTVQPLCVTTTSVPTSALLQWLAIVHVPERVAQAAAASRDASFAPLSSPPQPMAAANMNVAIQIARSSVASRRGKQRS